MIIIRVNGRPAPQGSKTRFPNGGMRESSPHVGHWREAIRAEAQRHMYSLAAAGDDAPYGYPVEVSVLFLFARPAGHYGTGKNSGIIRDSAPARPMIRGRDDIDKLLRAVLDGLTAGGIIADDGLVDDVIVSKDYCRPGETPGAWIRIEQTSAMLAAPRVAFQSPPAAAVQL